MAAIVIESRFFGIDLFTEDRRVFTRRLGLVGNPGTPCDVIRVYTKMNENFKGGINNVMIRSNDPVDSRHLQRCTDNGHRSSAHVSVRGKPIREKGRFGYVNTPVRHADWSVEYSVCLIPVGDIRIGYLRDPVDRAQSTDAAPLTKLLLFYTLRRLRNNCAAGYILCWTFCDTVWKPLSVEGLFLRRGAFQVCQAMEGAVLVDNRSGVSFDAELCIPWDAPRAVVDVTSTEAFTPVSLPHKVGLLGRHEDVDDRRILPDRDSQVVRFRRPEVHSVNRESCDVTIVVMKEDTSPGIPTLGTAVQSPGYTVPVEATRGASWVPDCTPAFPAPALRKGSQPRLSAWPLLCPRPAIIAPPVVGAGLAENKDAAVVEATGGSPSPMACRTGQVVVQPLSRKRLFDACNKPTELGRWPMFVNSERGRRCRGVSCNDHDSRTDLDTAAGALLHDPHMKNSTRMTEWARLFSRTPQYWLEHMGRERMVAAALRLHCDDSHIQANIHDMNQFLAGLYEAASGVLRESLSEQTRSSS